MISPDQLRERSKRKIKEVARKSLSKTLAIKRKLKQVQIKEEEERKKIRKKNQENARKQREKEKKEKEKREKYLQEMRYLYSLFDVFTLSAWNGFSKVTIKKNEIPNLRMVKNYGLKPISSEAVANFLNKELSKINKQIEGIDDFARRKIFVNKIAYRNCPLLKPENIIDKNFSYLNTYVYFENRVSEINNKQLQLIRELELNFHHLDKKISTTKHCLNFFASRLINLADKYSSAFINFQDEYKKILYSPPVEFFYDLPQLRCLTYVERLENKFYKFRVAKYVFDESNIQLPDLNNLNFNHIDSLIGHEISQPDKIDSIGRYLAFFSILCDVDAHEAISRNIKEDFVKEECADLYDDMAKLKTLAAKVSFHKKQLIEKDLLLQIKNKLNQVEQKIFQIRDFYINQYSKIDHNSRIFIGSHYFDLSQLTNAGDGNENLASCVKQIQWLLSRDGIKNKKLLDALLVQESENGKYTLKLNVVEEADSIHLVNNKSLKCKLKLKFDDLILLFKKSRFVCTTHKSRKSITLALKWY